MNRRSVKQRLIVEFQRELEQPNVQADDYLKTLIGIRLRELNGRGSGPLPYWAREAAKARGIQ